ncbi:MAG TPA: DUF5946 family protein [Phototrophicaceae bacterium]|nr:DUF5946 family protein [Phototrophicaceae bacterium]
MESKCPECRADWSNGSTCEDDFHQFGYWELADFEHLGVVHHLMVLSYHLQHPSLYSPEGLAGAKGLLVDFVARGMTPQQTRQRDRPKVDSGVRKYKITGTADAHGTYEYPVTWTMRAADVVAGGEAHYVENIRAWAQSIYAALKASDNLPAV